MFLFSLQAYEVVLHKICLSQVSPEWLHQHFRARECVRFRELQNPQFSSPCGEVDIVGYIVSIVGKQG